MDLEILPPELREKALNCEKPEDILELAKEEGYELSDEDLQGISGGWDDTCRDKRQLKPEDMCPKGGAHDWMWSGGWETLPDGTKRSWYRCKKCYAQMPFYHNKN